MHKKRFLSLRKDIFSRIEKKLRKKYSKDHKLPKNVISAADITFIMSSSTSAWLLSPLECSPQKQNG